MWIQLCIRTSDVEIIFTPVKMNITLYKYLICSFQGTIVNLWFTLQAISYAILVFEQIACAISRQSRNKFFLRKEFLICIIKSKYKRLIYLDNFDYIRFRNYPNGDKGIWTLDPLLARQVLSQLSYTPGWCLRI